MAYVFTQSTDDLCASSVVNLSRRYDIFSYREFFIFQISIQISTKHSFQGAASSLDAEEPRSAKRGQHVRDKDRPRGPGVYGTTVHGGAKTSSPGGGLLPRFLQGKPFLFLLSSIRLGGGRADASKLSRKCASLCRAMMQRAGD